MLDASTRRTIAFVASAQGLLFATLGIARWWTFHNETFDLAFYTRIAWGWVHLEFWEPIVNAHFYGLHLSVVLVPVGVLGFVFSTPVVLIAAQSAALAAASVPLSRIGARHLGEVGALVGALAWLLYPNLGHVAGYEVHPGTMAALGLAWMAYGIDGGSARAFGFGALFTLLCREDLSLVAMLGALLFAMRHREQRRLAALVGFGSLVYALVFFLILHPIFAPPRGSLQLHFGRFGNSSVEVGIYLVTHPGELFAHLATSERLLYLPKILAPLFFLPLARPRWLLPAAPIVAINLISEWPTTTSLEVHYLTPAVPFLIAGALEGAGAIASRAPMIASAAIVTASLVAHAIAGGTPIALDFDRDAFHPDSNTHAARAIVAAIPDGASVQAPDALLSHLAERKLLRRAASPEAGAEYFVLDVSHRRRFAAREDVLRTVEEPLTRTWLARDDHRLVAAAGDYLLFERRGHPRQGRGGDAIVGRADPNDGTRIAACLAILEARIDGNRLIVDFVARDSCPNDLAIRIGTGRRPRRVDLLFGGLLSPHHLVRGDRVRSMHALSPAERAALEERGLRIGALRSSGARPEHGDPVAVDVPLTRD